MKPNEIQQRRMSKDEILQRIEKKASMSRWKPRFVEALKVIDGPFDPADPPGVWVGPFDQRVDAENKRKSYLGDATHQMGWGYRPEAKRHVPSVTWGIEEKEDGWWIWIIRIEK